MSKRLVAGAVALFFVFILAGTGLAGEVEILGVKFPTEKTIAGKTLQAQRRILFQESSASSKYTPLAFILKTRAKDPNEVIESEQVKYMLTHYLTSKATAKKISEGIRRTDGSGQPRKNWWMPTALDIDKYASWLDTDMKPGLTSESVYVPGKGITLTYQGQVKGTIEGNTFAQMYYRYNVGEKADKKIRDGLLGL
jgi:hypothetical protein